MSAAKIFVQSLREEAKTSGNHISSSYMELVSIFPLQPITSEKSHRGALNVVEKIISFMASDRNPDEGMNIYLKVLSDLVSDYESKKYRSMDVSGKDMLAYLMELQGLNQSDFAKEIGGQPIVSKILKGERELNLRQIKALSKRFKVSPEVFI